MARVVTLGEILLRLQPFDNEKFLQCSSVEFSFGGSEANTAVSLALFGIDSVFVSKLPDNSIGQAGINSMRKYGVDTKHILRGGDRTGIYFNEKGAGVRSSVCVYDRKGSAISEALPSEFNWDEILKGADIFHFSGITAALSEDCSKICMDAVSKAKEMGVKVSCDLNYRAKLWSKEDARKTMTKLAPYVDICIFNEDEARDVLGIEGDPSSSENERYMSLAKKLCSEYNFEMVAINMVESRSASDNGWSSMVYDAKEDFFAWSPKYDIHIVDRVGIGDAFGAGLIYSILNNMSTQECCDFATAASALKYTIPGDANLVSASDVFNLMKTGGSARIQR